MNKAWSYVTLSVWRRTEYMVIKPMTGGGWRKICICATELDAKLIVGSVNDRMGAKTALAEVRNLTKKNAKTT